MAQFSFKSSGKTLEEIVAAELASARAPIGPATPLREASSGGDMFVMNMLLPEAVHDNLRNMLLTNRGERLVLTDYGANLLPLASEYADIEKFDAEAITRIRAAVGKWMPHVELENYASEARAGAVFLTISYNVPSIGVSDRVLQIELRIT